MGGISIERASKIRRGKFFEFWDENNGYHDEDDNNGNGGLTMMEVSNVNGNISKRKSDKNFTRIKIFSSNSK